MLVYNIDHICDGCDMMKKTTEVHRLDPRRPEIINFLCKKCANSHHAIPKILKFNNIHFKETHSIFGFSLEDSKKIKEINITIFK